MAFGRLTTKWRIFRKNLNYSSKKISLICRSAARLHNFVIDFDDLNFKNVSSLEGFGVERVDGGPGVSTNNYGYRAPLPSRSRDPEPQQSRRDDILDEIIAMDLCRPEHNLLRNEGEPMESDEKTVYEEDVVEE